MVNFKEVRTWHNLTGNHSVTIKFEMFDVIKLACLSFHWKKKIIKNRINNYQRSIKGSSISKILDDGR